MKNIDSKQRLFEVMGRLDKTFKPKLNESPENNQEEYDELVGFMMEWWSKKEDNIRTLNSSKYLRDTFGKYFQYTENDWRRLSYDEIKNIGTQWHIAYNTINKITRDYND